MWQFKATTNGILLVLLATVTVAQRVAPGVPPQHYQAPNQQQQQQMHPQHQQQQQQQYQQQQIHVAPGVAPQQYQQYQQPPVAQQQQPPQQYQQQQQYQQPPVPQAHPPQPQVQQQQVPQHQQQQAHHQQHAPHAHHGQQVLHTGNIQDERAHIQEHMQVPIDTSKMSEAELQFHYFKMHDSDNNNKLDGCELIKSLIHWHVEDPKAKTGDSAAQPASHADASKPKEGGTGEKNGTVYTDEGLADIIDYVLKTMDMNKDGYVDYPEYLTTNDAVGKD